jgi:hypothetical protein
MDSVEESFTALSYWSDPDAQTAMDKDLLPGITMFLYKKVSSDLNIC